MVKSLPATPPPAIFVNGKSRWFFPKRYKLVCGLLFACLLAFNGAMATTYYFNTTSGSSDFATYTNWYTATGGGGTQMASNGYTTSNTFNIPSGQTVSVLSASETVGTITVASGGTLTLPSGSNTLTTHTTFTNSGTLTINGSTLAVTTTLSNTGSLTVSGGTLTVTTAVTTSGTLSVSSGTLTASTTLANSGTLSVSGGNLNITGASTTGVTSTAGSFTVNGGTVTLGAYAASNCNRTFNVTGGTFTVSSGTLNIYGNFIITGSSGFTQSGGTISVDGNYDNGASGGVASGTPIVQIGNSNSTYPSLTLTGGTIIIVDPSYNSSTSSGTGTGYALYVDIGSSYIAGTGHTIQFGNGSASSGASGGNAGGSAGFLVGSWLGDGGFTPGNVIVNTTASSNAFVNTQFDPGSFEEFAIAGNLTVTNGEFRDEGSTIYIGGNVAVTSPGIYTCTGTMYLGTATFGTSTATAAATTTQQTVGGTGTYRNATSGSTADLTNLTVWNTYATNPGVTLSASLSVSGTITLTSGVVATGSNVLSTTHTATTAVARTSGWVYGSLEWSLPHITSSTTYVFPLGNDIDYLPASMKFTATNAAGTVTGTLTYPGPDPNSGSPVSASNNVNDYWTFASSFSTVTVTPTFTYNAADITSGSTQSSFIGANYNSTWSAAITTTNAGSGPYTSAFPSQSTLAGDFVVGNTLPCSGTPAPGNTVSSANGVCPGASGTPGSFTLSLTNATSGSGVSYAWYSSATGSGYASISGATNSTYSPPTETSSTYYECQVTCGSNTGTSTPLKVTTSLSDACYCTPTLNDGPNEGYNFQITNVTFPSPAVSGDINQTTSNTTDFNNYTSQTATLTIGSSYTLSVSANTDGGGQSYKTNITAFIDWNQTGLFTGGTGDVTYDVGAAKSPSSITETTSIMVPATATPGPTVMRVMTTYNGYSSNSCTPSNNYGAVQDYTINVVAACTPPSTLAGSTGTAVTSTASGSTTATLNAWTSDGTSAAGAVVVLYPAATAGSAPTSGTTYSSTSGNTTISGTPTGTVVYVGAATSAINLTGLTPGTAYTAVVYGYTGTTCYNTTATAGTNQTTFYTLPSCVTYSAPTNAATCQSLTPTLSWTAGAGATAGYNVYLSTTNPPTGTEVATNQSGTTYTPSAALTANTTYYWEVVPVNGGGASNSGCATVYSFSTVPAAPAAPTSNSPQCAGTGVTFTQGTCTSGCTCYWETSATGNSTSIGSASTYTTATTSSSYTIYVQAYNGSCYSTASSAAGTVNSSSLSLATGTEPTAASQCAGTSNVILENFTLATGTSCPGNLTDVSFKTTGTYATADITDFNLYYGSTSTFSNASVIATISPLTASGATTQTFPAISSPTLNSSSTYYFWITADISPTVTDGDYITVSALATTNLTSTSTLSGSASAGGKQTLKASPTATNGSSGTICGSGSVTLSGNNPTSIGASATGAWTVASGPSTASGQFNSTSTYNTTFTPAGGAGSYVLNWTTSNSPCAASSPASATVTENTSSILFTQLFNVAAASFPPTNWTVAYTEPNTNHSAPSLTTVTSGSDPSCTASDGTGYNFLEFNSFSTGANNTATLEMSSAGAINTSAYTGISVNFDWLEDNGETGLNDEVTVIWNNGTSGWTNATTYSRYNSNDNSPTWTHLSCSLPAGAVTSALQIGFLFTSDYGNNCHLDNVTVTGCENCTPPTSLAGSTGTVVSSTATGTSTATLNAWSTDGTSATGAVVVLYPAATPGAAPTVGTTYSSTSGNTTISGTPTGAVEYVGAATSAINLTGLTQGTAYTAVVYGYTGTTCYNTTATAGTNQTTFYTYSSPPTASVSGFGATAACGAVTLNWSALTYPSSTTDGYIILQNSTTTPAISGSTSGIAPGSLALSSGSSLAATVTSGTTTSQTISGLANGQTYYFTIIPYTYNGANTQTYSYYTTGSPAANATPGSTPVPGNTISSATGVCPSTSNSPGSFTLSLQNTLPAGVSYAWYSSATGSGYAAISNATNSTYSPPTETSSTYYECQVTCGSNTGTSTPLDVTTGLTDACYCTPTNTNGYTDFQITNVTFPATGGINQATSSNNNSDDINYTADAAPTVTIGSSYTLSVTAYTDGGEHTDVTAFIDWNHTGSFTGTGAVTYNIGSGNSNPSITVGATNNIAVPAGASPGTTIMRVQSTYNGYSTNPCSQSYGVVQDYAINVIAACTPPTTQATNLTSSAIGQATATINLPSGDMGSGNDVLIVAYPAATAGAAPASGTTYSSQSLMYDGGSAVGTGYVVYNGDPSGAEALNITNLSPGTEYTFVAYAYATTGPCYNSTVTTTTGGNATTFYTLPACVTYTAPTNNAACQSLTPTLTWTAGSGTTTGYNVYLDNTNGTTLVSTNQAGTSYTPSAALTANTTYYWQIVPVNAEGAASSYCSTVYSFTTGVAAPTTPTVTSACLDQTGSAIETGAPTSGTWTWYWETATTGTNGTSTAHNADAAYPSGSLVNGTTYYVIPTNGSCWGTPSTGVEYTTGTGLGGTYYVGTNASYTNTWSTISAALSAATSSGLCSATTFILTNTSYTPTTEGVTFPLVIGPYANMSSTNTLTIEPANSTAVTISTPNTREHEIFSITSSSSTKPIYVTINGQSPNNTGSLTLSTTYDGDVPVTTSGSYCNSVTIENCTLLNYSTGNNTQYGAINATGTGVINVLNNTIGNNTAGGTSTFIGILVNNANAACTLTATGNNIYNDISDGIYIEDADNGCNISNNSFYYTGTFSATNTEPAPIAIEWGGGHTISGNYIGGQSANCGGSPWTFASTVGNYLGPDPSFCNDDYYYPLFFGIVVYDGSGNTNAASTISNNTINNLSFGYTGSGSLQIGGIQADAAGATPCNISGNTVGIASGNSPGIAVGGAGGTGAYSAFAIESFTAGNITNNTVANIATTGTAASVSTSYTSGSNCDNSKTETFSSAIGGIICAPSTTAEATGTNITGNNVYNLSEPSTSSFDISQDDPSVEAPAIGIYVGDEGDNIINGTGVIVANNTIYNIQCITTSSSAYPAVIGIGCDFNSGDIYDNLIYGLTNSAKETSTLPGIAGIRPTGVASSYASAWKIYNNQVILTNGSNTNSVRMYGMSDLSGTTNAYYFNSAYISNTTGGSSGISSAWDMSYVHNNNVLTVEDNLLYNTSTTGAGNFAMTVMKGGTVPTSLASSRNDLYSSGSTNSGFGAKGPNVATSSTTLSMFAGWSPSGDANSINQPVLFNQSNPPTTDLTPSSYSNCNFVAQGLALTSAQSNGITFPPSAASAGITVDYNNNTRPYGTNTKPNIGAIEFIYNTNTLLTLSSGSSSSSTGITVCAGSSVTAAASTSNPGTLSYLWSTPDAYAVGNNASFTRDVTTAAPTDAGTYKVTVTDNVSCTSTASAVLAIVNPTATISGTTTACKNGAEPVITFTGSNGTEPYTFTYSINGAGSYTVSTTSSSATATVSVPTSASGAYVYALTNVQESSAVACSQPVTSQSATVTVDQLPSVTISGGTTAICNGNAPGTFTASPSGGSGSGYTYQWYDNNGTLGSAATNITYTPGNLTASDAYYCKITNTACGQTATSGTISITVDGVVGASISGGPSGPICNSADPGTLTATGSGGDGINYTYQWWGNEGSIGSATNSTYDPGALTAGDAYYCVITNTGCSQSATSSTITVSVYQALSAGISGGTTAICTGGDPGAMTATGVNGSGSYTYQWYNGGGSIGSSATSSTYDPGSLATGSYTYYCIVTDAAGCGTANSGSQNISVYTPVSNYGTINASAGANQSLCANVVPSGPFTVTGAAGGSGTFTYQWYYQSGIVGAPASTDAIPGTWTACASAQGTGYDAANFVPAGTPASISYACVVTPAGGVPSCAGTATWASGGLQMTVAAPTASIDGGDLTVCEGYDGIMLGATTTSGFTATWQWYSSTDNVSFSPISNATSTSYQPGTSSADTLYYNAIATYSSGTGCTPATSNSESVIVDNLPTFSTIGTTSICTGGTNTLTVTVSGGVSAPTGFQWQYYSGASWSNVYSGVPADINYSVSSSGQSSTITFTTTSGVSNNNRTYQVIGSFTGLGCPTTVDSKTTSNEGVLVIESQPVSSIITPNVAAGDVCAGQELSAAFNGASGGSGTVTNVYEYSTDGGNTFNPYIQNNPISTSSLGGDNVVIETYTTATGSGCNTSPANTLTWGVVAQPVAATITPDIAQDNIVCAGQTLSATFGSGGSGGSGTVADVYEYSTDGGSTYNTYTGGQSISTDALAGQTVIIRSSRTATGTGCNTSSYNTVSWTVNANPSVTASNTGPYCSYGVIAISANPSGYSYQWTGPGISGTANGISQTLAASGNAGVYTVTATDAIGCSSTASTNVVVNVIAASASNTGPYCAYNDISLSSTPSGDNYSWAGPNGYASGNQDPAAFTAAGNGGTYTLTVTDGTGCTATASTDVVVSAAISASASNTGPYVAGQTIELSATSAGATGFAWSGPGYNGSGASPNINNATTAMSGTYTVTASNSAGCTATASTEVVVTSTATYTWTGTTSSDWTAPANWSPASPVGGPNACAISVVIPSATNNPVISSSVSVGNVQMNTGSVLTLKNSANISVCGNWTGSSGTKAVVIGTGIVELTGNTTQTISGATRVQELNLDNSAGASMTSGSALDVYTSLDLQTGNFDATNGTLTFKSDSVDSVGIIDNFSEGNNGTLTGSITAERYYAASLTYNQHYMGSPVNSPSLANQFGASGTAGQVTDADCDETQLTSTSDYGTVFEYNQAGGSACSMQGWVVVTSGNAQNGLGYSVLKPGNGKLILSGTANLNSSYGLSGLQNSGWQNNTLQHHTQISGWQLVSNPYLATLQISTVSEGFDNQIQVWNANGPYAGSYQSGVIGGAYPVVPAVIAPFQGFMVHVTTQGNTSAVFTMNASDRVRAAQQFFQQSANQLNIVAANAGNGLLDQTTVAFNNAATDTFDPQFDAQKFAGSLNRQTIYTVNNGLWMSNNVLNNIATTSTVPMGFEPGANGTFTLNFNGVNSFDPTSYIYLEDQTTGTMYNVRNGNYTFTADSADKWNRFVLHFTPPAVINTVDATCSTGGTISIEQPGIANWSYTLTDVNNAIVTSGTLNQSSPVTVQVGAGTYTLTLTDANNYTAVKAITVTGPAGISASFAVSADTVQQQQTIALTATTPGAASYLWNFGNGTTASGADATVSYAQPGVYVLSLLVTNNAGCSSTQTRTVMVTPVSTTGLGNVTGTGDIAIWSNENKVYVDFNNVKLLNALVIIYDILGQQISNENVTSQNLVYQKEILNIDAAYLIVMVKNDDKVTARKVFIANTK